MDTAYAIAGLAIGAVIIMISLDVLTGGRIAGLLGGAAGLAVVPPAEEESA